MDAVCGACGHQREPDASAPEWQCPSCGKAYAKTVHDSPSPLTVYDDGVVVERPRGTGGRYFLIVPAVMLGSSFLTGAIFWVLIRFHLAEAGHPVFTLLRFLAAFPVATGSLLMLLGYIRNAFSGFVFGCTGMQWREMYAAEEPLAFTFALIAQLTGWSAMAYIFFELTIHASNWTTADF